MDYIRALALKSRRNYRVLALMVGIIIIGACFSLVGIFLFAGKERIPEQSPPAKSDGSRALSVDVAEHQSASVAPSLPAKERSEAPEAGRDQASKNAATQETAPNATAGTSIPHKSQDTVHIRLVGLPETASVLVNGKAAELPLVVSRSQQPIKIEARAPGYETAVKRVVPGQDKTVKIQMEQGGGAIGTESDEESVQQKRLASNPFRS